MFNSSLHETRETSTAVLVRFADTMFDFRANLFAFQAFYGPFTDDVKLLVAPAVA